MNTMIREKFGRLDVLVRQVVDELLSPLDAGIERARRQAAARVTCPDCGGRVWSLPGGIECGGCGKHLDLMRADNQPHTPERLAEIVNGPLWKTARRVIKQ